MTASRGIAPPRVPWTDEEDAILLANITAMGSRKLAASGLLPGRLHGQIRGRHKLLRGVNNPGRHTTKPLRPVPQFERQHVSVWGYARTVGDSA